MAQKIVPCLWFDNNGAEAVKVYTSLFENSQILGEVRYGDAAANAAGMPEGSVMTIPFKVAGYEMLALNAGPHFQFTQALSFMISCSSKKEIDFLWENLSQGGITRMELKRYPFAEKYGWCQDRFGLSWQMIYSGTQKDEGQKIVPALLFVQEQAGRSEEAMRFYTSLFSNSKVTSISRDEKTNVNLHGRFTLNGESFVAFESPTKHDFRFNNSVSFMVNCEDQKEIDYFWARLSAKKEAEQCGWLMDQFGVSWQIVPASLKEMLLNKDTAKKERVMAAVMQMKKLDLEKLRKAQEG